MDPNNKETIQKNFPFLSGIRYREKEYVCIIQNADDKIISLYDYNILINDVDRLKFLSFGDTWWWESNRIIPINIFLSDDFNVLKYCLITLVSKDVEILFGPVTSLQNITKKRIKRRQIQLIRKIT